MVTATMKAWRKPTMLSMPMTRVKIMVGRTRKKGAQRLSVCWGREKAHLRLIYTSSALPSLGGTRRGVGLFAGISSKGGVARIAVSLNMFRVLKHARTSTYRPPTISLGID